MRNAGSGKPNPASGAGRSPCTPVLVEPQDSSQDVKMSSADFRSLQGWMLVLIFEHKKKGRLAAVWGVISMTKFLAA